MSTGSGDAGRGTYESSDARDLARSLEFALGDDYKVVRPLGAGGFAVVFLVKDLRLRRNLAVKVMSPDFISSKAALDRFQREAETVAGLSHPNIVPMHFVGQRDGLSYLAMECVEGGSLAQRLEKEGHIGAHDVRRMLCEVASALAHAHKRGIVHRDIKPQNILLDAESGRCLVADFGIARTPDSSLTATGMIVGTPAYISPEQVAGLPMDHRSDLYALGVMGYELLVGKLPFDAATPAAVMMMRLTARATSVASSRPDAPTDLARAIDRCLEQDPNDRFQSAGGLIDALSHAPPPSKESLAPTITIGTIRRNSRTRAAIIGGGLALAAGISWLVWLQQKPPAAGSVLDPGMVAIPAGTYVIGFDAGPLNARPAHQVQLAAFAIDRNEVTVGDYIRFVDSTQVQVPWVGAQPDRRLPVTRVELTTAMEYCRWAHHGQGRLPSEEEWEAAARGPGANNYPWGNTFIASAANTLSARRDSLMPVGSFTAGSTPTGLNDLIGNVWEWTSSPMRAYATSYAPASATSQFTVIRGGAFGAPDSIATAWFRGVNRSAATRDDLSITGFRCVVPLATK